MAKRGRKGYERNEAHRKQIESLVAVGVSHEQVALVVGISEDTLTRYYSEELETAVTRANARVAGMLYQKALRGDTTSIIFWLKTRARWRESQTVEHTGPGGGAIAVKHVDGPPQFSSIEEWSKHRERMIREAEKGSGRKSA